MIQRYEHVALRQIQTPGGVVDTAGGNLRVTRRDLDVDTRLGNLAVGAVWNSATSEWLWSFDMIYDGETFIDETGARHDVSSLAAGETIRGTHWVHLGPTQIQTKGGKRFTFSPSGKLQTVSWGAQYGAWLSYATAPIGSTERVTRIDSCRDTGNVCTLAFSIAYDAAGRVASIVDRAAREAFFAYDAAGRLAQARDALDVANGWPGWRYEYDGQDLTARTNSEGERVEYAYAEGRLVEVRQIGLGDPTWSFDYLGVTDGFHTTRVVDPQGGVKTFRFDFGRRVRSLTDEVGNTTSWTWKGKRPTSRTDAWGAVTSWGYLNDDVVTETQSTGRVISYGYRPNGIDRNRPLQRAIETIWDDLGSLTWRTYGQGGELASNTPAGGPTLTYSYTADGDLASVSGLSGGGVSFSQYGEHGRPEQVEKGGVIDYRIYDGVGNLLEGGVDVAPEGVGVGGVVSRDFDADRNLARLVLSNLDSTSSTSAMTVTSTDVVEIDWRSNHRRTEIRRPFGGDSRFLYDAHGRLAMRRDRVDGAWTDTTFEHDAAGNRTAIQRPNGMRTVHSYDASGRYVEIAHHRDGTLESSVAVGWVGGLLESLLDSVHGAPETRTRDASGRITQIVYPAGEVLQVGYDSRSRVVSQRLLMPDGSVLRELDYAYDEANRVVSVRDGGFEILADTYASGALIQRDYGNGLSRSFELDPETGELWSTTTTNGQSSVVESSSIIRGDCLVAGVTSECVTVDTSTWVGIAATTNERYQFSNSLLEGPEGQRVGRWVDLNAAGQASETYYSYDALSNLVAVGDGSGVNELVYNPERNRVIAVERDGATLADYGYDDAGFVTSRSGEAVTWTAHGRVSGIGSSQSFAWDSFGRPTLRISPAATAGFRFGGAVETDLAGAPRSLDLGVVRISLDGGSNLYRHYDFRNNVKFVTDAAGTVVAHYHYSAFGLENAVGTGADGQQFAQGRGLGGLVQIGARVYDPLIGRFLSSDPIYQLLDQHAYTAGNPVAFWDPSGRAYFRVKFKFGLTGIEFEVEWGTGDPPPPPDADAPQIGSPSGSDQLPPGGDGAGGDCGCSTDGSGGSGGDSEGSGGSGLGGGGGYGGCSQSPTRIPHARTLLAVLLPMQLILGVWVLRERRRAEDDVRSRSE